MKMGLHLPGKSRISIFSLTLAVALTQAACSSKDETTGTGGNPPQQTDNPAPPAATPPPALPAAPAAGNTEPAPTTAPAATTPVTDPESEKTEVPIASQKAQVSISQDAIARSTEFLIQSTVTEQAAVPQGHPTRSRVVYFKRREGRIYLFESLRGRTIDPKLGADLLLAEFKILRETPERVFIDFNSGVLHVFVADELHVQDLAGREFDPGVEAVKTKLSFIDSADGDPMTRAVIRQVAQFDLAASLDGSVRKLVSVEVVYTLQPYHPNAGYQPLASPGQDPLKSGVGFFEISPQLVEGSGTTVVYAMRFDPSPDHKITYAVSPNTPEPFRAAVKEGALYWNRAFGYEKIQVVDAPAGEAYPSATSNVIQWVDWSEAPMSYASVQADPRTGEVLGAQVYLTSAFAYATRNEARALLRRLETTARKTGPRMNLSNNLCEMGSSADAISEWRDHLADALIRDAADEELLRISQDTIRDVVAHEVGHTLGLRHNFAGSVASNVPAASRQSVFETYVSEGLPPPGTQVSSTVMDYLRMEESAISGSAIRSGAPALTYDAAAIAALYRGETRAIEEMPPFCTDGDLMTDSYIDCRAFDAGPSPAAIAAQVAISRMNQLPAAILESFTAAKALGLKGGVAAVRLDPMLEARRVLEGRALVARAMTSGGPGVLQVVRHFDFVNSSNQAAVRAAEAEFLSNDIATAGGMETVFSTIGIAESLKVADRFDSLMTRAELTSGTTVGGLPYELSTDDQTLMKTMVRSFARELATELAREDIATFTETATREHPLEAGDLTARLATILFAKAQVYALATTSESIVEEIADPRFLRPHRKATVKLPVFAYPNDVRISAALDLLAVGRSQAAEWGDIERAMLRVQFNAMLETAMSKDLRHAIKKTGYFSMPASIRRWITENESIATAM